MEPAVHFRRLLPAGAPVDAAELLDDLHPERRAPPGRPHIAVNMISSVDGRGALDGRTRGLGNAGDRALFHRLRAQADAVMAGASTIRAERYGPLIRDTELIALRRARGEPVQPVAVTASRSLDFDPALPLLADPDSHLVVLTPSAGELPPCAARVTYIRGTSLTELVAALRAELGVRSVVCEGGPTLNGELVAAGLVDELFLSISPLLVGGRRPLTIVEGAPALTGLELIWLLEYDGLLQARYRAVPPGGA
ncbi:MAG: dihydrofolate reductase family protein [Solirubrobacteraceae bacterium]